MSSAGGNKPAGPPSRRLGAAGRRRSVEDPRPRLLNLGAVGLGWFLVLGGAFIAWFVIAVPLRREILDNDLTLTYIGARIGIEHGWSHLYSLTFQHQLFVQLRPGAPFHDGERFISPPPSAWVLVPLTFLGAVATVYVWLAASVAALVAAWWIAAPGSARARTLWLIAALAWYPVQYSLSLAQPGLIILLAVVACWKLAEMDRPYLAGVVLGVSVLKPQLVLAVPLVLLASGRWRIAAAWAVTVGLLAVASVLAIGPQGLSDYRMLLSDAEHVSNNRYFTAAYVFGFGPLTYAVQAILVAIGVAGAYVNRHSSLARLFALGIVTSTLGASYWHLQDYAILVGAFWFFWRDPSPGWQRWWLVVVAVACELGWPLTPLPILVGLTVWLIYLALPEPRALRTARAT